MGAVLRTPHLLVAAAFPLSSTQIGPPHNRKDTACRDCFAFHSFLELLFVKASHIETAEGTLKNGFVLDAWTLGVHLDTQAVWRQPLMPTGYLGFLWFQKAHVCICLLPHDT